MSPVWHEWRDGGFGIITGIDDVKLRHVEHQSWAAAVVSDNDQPYRGIEVSGVPSIIREAEIAHAAFKRIVERYLGAERAGAYIDRQVERMVLIRLEPGRLRTWDFADDYHLVDGA